MAIVGRLRPSYCVLGKMDLAIPQILLSGYAAIRAIRKSHWCEGACKVRIRLGRITMFAAIVLAHYAVVIAIITFLSQEHSSCLDDRWNVEGWCQIFTSNITFGFAILLILLNPAVLAVILKLFDFSATVAVICGVAGLALNFPVLRGLGMASHWMANHISGFQIH